MKLAPLTLLFFSWGAIAAPKVSWVGDLRLRAQAESPDPNDSRFSEAYRARFGLKSALDDRLSAQLRLASAKSNRSVNQTVGDSKEPGFVRRTIGLDLAYAEWKIADFGGNGAVAADIGRYPLQHFRPGESQLVLDADLALEGAALKTDFAIAEGWKFFGTAGSSWIRENYDTYYSEKNTDNMIHWVQAGLDWRDGDRGVKAGAGFFNFVGLQGLLFSNLSDGGAPNGNSEAASGVVRNGYIPKEVFVEAVWTRAEGTWSVFAEKISNDETRDPHEGSWTGIKFARDEWSAKAGWVELQSDATSALFTDSDFASGKTDSRGSILSLRKEFGPKIAVQVTQFSAAAMVGLERYRFSRTQADFSLAF